ncbi:hypothetical protein FKW77_002648 [Venturia effusa]|uniref:Serine aminopeptidase S33 domain-containing protein n=1 Tax=Venturia effusa TaxID=50376 RepID=A0A517L8U7_9PEZI|nr:hypothetical protein FKW77_002648 [Venturia effusa]
MASTTSTLDSGAVLHTWEVENPRAVVVLQHGFGEYAERFVHQHNKLITRLNQRRIQVLGMDMLGHGQSPNSRGVVNLDTAIQDHAKVRSIAEESNVPVFLFGHSLGGLLTIGSAIHRPEEVCGVIVTGPALPLPTSGVFERMLGIAAKVIPETSIPIPASPLQGLSRCPEVAQSFQDDPLTSKRQIPFLVASTATVVANNVWKTASQWKCPTLILHGTADKYCKIAGSRRFINMIESSDKRMSEYEGGQHELLNDLEKDKALAEVLEWISARIK